MYKKVSYYSSQRNTGWKLICEYKFFSRFTVIRTIYFIFAEICSLFMRKEYTIIQVPQLWWDSCNHSKQIFFSTSSGDESPGLTAKLSTERTELETYREENPTLGSDSSTSLLKHQVLTLATALHPHDP